jgi:ribonuclease HI
MGTDEGSPPEVDLFTDGACSGNPGPGGWAYILKHPKKKVPNSDGDPNTTNNKMELTAVIRGLKALTRKCKVRLYSDSKYVLDGITTWMIGWQKNGWKKGPKAKGELKNVELWKQVWELIQKHEVTTIWVQGHAGHPENEECDKLAKAAAQRAAATVVAAKPTTP